MSECKHYDPDNVFKRFKVIEFPVSFLGLFTERYLNVETNLTRDAYLKTMCDGSLVKFYEARKISPSHRAFLLEQVNEQTVKITFNPTNECITNTKRHILHDNRFVFDLRLIRVSGSRCCSNEFHSEIGRYYISGQYEHCNLSHYPKIINFGDVDMNTEITKHVKIKNGSRFNATNVNCIKVTGFDVFPCKFVIPPHSSKRLRITSKPTSLVMKSTLPFEVRNPHCMFDETNDKSDQNIEDDNFISYSISCKINVIFKTKKTNTVVESMHKLNEPDMKYTHIDEKTINQQKERRKKAFTHLEVCKSNYAKKTKTEKKNLGKDRCYSDLSFQPRRLPKKFCKPIIERINTYALFDVLLLPYLLRFGKIAYQTYGEQEILIKNKSRFVITIQFQRDTCILYSDKKLATMSLKINSFAETKLKVLCLGHSAGKIHGTFNYLIDNNFYKKHKYSIKVGNPVLRIQENVLKFGMITSDSFVTSVPVKIYNDFNIPVEYKWQEFNSDLPFDIIPRTGIIPEHSCRISEVIYISKLTKSKTHEINFISKSNIETVIPVELNVITRKLTVKFLQQAVIFKDVALNTVTIERIKLENSSKEIASFFIVEPLIPGLRVEPMCGNIRPKMVINFEIILYISCVLEFTFDIVVRINNKENVTIPVSGNVVEPKLTIHPKTISLTRIPCGMVTYVPVTFQNSGSVRAKVEVLDTGDEDLFNVYTIMQGNERQRILEFFVDSGQSKTVFIKVFDIFRREYDMFIPFKINGLLGPPNGKPGSLELQFYIGEFESLYENNIRVKIKRLNKDISYCRIVGVITVPWIEFSVDKFEIEYVPNGDNKIEFNMKNISKYNLNVTVITSKLSPIFTLDVDTGEIESIVNENNIKFELCRNAEVAFTLKFHPKMHGRYVSTAILFLDKHMSTPYYNLTFIGNRQMPAMTPSKYRIIFPPSHVGTSIVRILTVKMGFVADIDQFSCFSKDEPHLDVKFLNCNIFHPDEEDLVYSSLTVEIRVSCNKTYARHLMLNINHMCGSGCEIEINFCFTNCILTLHAHSFISSEEDPYPYYPEITQCELYNYMESCTQFLEKWMFQQGFRRDLYPEIPDTFYAISTFLSSQLSTGTKTKGINATYLNFMRRIAGPMMKYIHKANAHGVDESFKCVKEIHDTYKEILHLLRSRGCDLWNLQAKFLLSYDQFVMYADFVTPRCNTDILLTQELLGDINLFNRLSKQCWVDVILQCYKVFVMESCFFECVCVSNESRDIVRILLDWYNAQIALQHHKLIGKNKPVKIITNLTTDLTDGIALASALLNYCPFLLNQFAMLADLEYENKEASIINNACLIIEAMNLLRLYFPLSSTDFLEPNFLHMLFLSIHLYVVLPMFKPKDTIRFMPPLLRSSTRTVAVYSATQESLTFSFVLLNNNRNNFIIEKVPSAENGKKMFLSVKYIANFVSEEKCVLLVHGYNKTRIFDTYMIFLLEGGIGALNPVKKCKVTGPLYRSNKVDIPVSSPFMTSATFSAYVTDSEPFIPVEFENIPKHKFFVRRLNLIDKEVVLAPTPKDNAQDGMIHKVYLQLMCLSTPIGNSWIWFRGEIGEFFIRVTTQPRWDLALDTLQAKVDTWPLDPCSCGEACECYRTTILSIPHRNDLMIKALRYSLLEHASDCMMQIFDGLIETTTGKQILGMLLEEGGTNMADVKHILRSEINYRITSKALLPQLDRVVLAHHTPAILPLPVTIPTSEKSEKYSVTFTSNCGMDIRTYKIIFMQSTCSMQAA